MCEAELKLLMSCSGGWIKTVFLAQKLFNYDLLFHGNLKEQIIDIISEKRSNSRVIEMHKLTVGSIYESTKVRVEYVVFESRVQCVRSSHNSKITKK